MEKRKAGLQKLVSTIFDGVPIPKDNGAQQPSGAPAPERPDYEGHPEHDKGLRAPALAKPPAPSHLTPTTPKPQEPVELPPKAAPAKQTKADAAVKTARQIPWQQTLERIRNKLFAPKPGVSNRRQKTMTIMVPVLFIVLIFVFTQVLSTPSHKITKAQGFGPASAVAGSNKIDWQIPAPYSTTLRDPMQFGSTTTQSGTGGLIVKGIVFSKDNPSAVIGDQIVHEGDKVLGATIVKINVDSVDFERNDKKWTQKVQR